MIVVEEWAHRPEGHFPVLFADVATGLAEIGCTVDVLVQRSWVHADEWGPVPFTVHRYRGFGRFASRLGGRLGNVGSTTRAGCSIRALGSMLRSLVMTREVRALGRRRSNESTVIVLSTAIDPLVVAARGGPRSWLVYEFRGPQVRVPLMTKALERSARRAEARRRQAGSCVRVVSPDLGWSNEWAELVPFLDPAVGWISGARASARIADARTRLGIDPGDRVALVYGVAHEFKDHAVAWQAFAELDDWRLLVVGRVADELTAAIPPWEFARAPVCVGGHVSVECRDLAHAAADVVVLSFRDGTRSDSGSLMDAIASGVPVVCSARSTAADLVTEYRLGPLFEPGDHESLVAAIRRVPALTASGDLDRARRECSAREVARRLLDLLEPD